MWRRLLPWCAAMVAFEGIALAAKPPPSPSYASAAVESGVYPVSVTFSETGEGAVAIKAECAIPRPAESVWRVISDYDHLAEFVPSLTESRIVRREGAIQILHQRGRARFLFFRRAFSVTFRVEETPPREIRFEAFEGDFKQFKGSWRLEAHPEGTLVRHEVVLEPAFFVPRWILRAMERHILLTSMRAIIRRCME